MADKNQYKPDYLKITLQNEDSGRNLTEVVRAQLNLMVELGRSPSQKKDPRAFGSFDDKFRSNDWAVLGFNPYSADLGFSKRDTVYHNRAQALNAALQHLNDKGYEVKLFDLEGIVDKI